MADSTSSFLVQPPFEAESPGDCLLQSPNGTQFKAYRAILCAASSVFRDMFSMPSKPSDGTENETETPVIPIEEDAETLHVVLQMLYPIDPPAIKSLPLAEKLVKAFDKYFFSMAKLRQHIQKTLILKESLESDPLSCFAIAWKLGLPWEAETASRYTHTLNLSDVAIGGGCRFALGGPGCPGGALGSKVSEGAMHG